MGYIITNISQGLFDDPEEILSLVIGEDSEYVIPGYELSDDILEKYTQYLNDQLTLVKKIQDRRLEEMD